MYPNAPVIPASTSDNDLAEEAGAITQAQADLDLRKYLAQEEEARKIAEAQAELDQRKANLAAEEQRQKRQVEAHCAAISAAVAQEQRQKLEVKHKELVEECRAALGNYERLADEIEELNRELFRARANVENAERQVGNARASMPRADRYPSAEEMAAWERRVKQAQAALARASEAEGKAWRQIEANRRERLDAKQKLERLADQEKDMREKLQLSEPRPSGTITYGSNGVSVVSNGVH